MQKRYIHKNGTFIWAHLSVSLARDAAGNPHHFISQIQNKTEQYQKQKQLDSLLEHEKFQRLLIANMAAGVGVWEHDLINDRLIWDTQMIKLYGKSSTSDHSNYDMWVSSLHPDDKQRCQEAIRAALSGEKDFNTEFRVIWPDGSIHYIRGMARVSRDDDGVPIKMVGTNWDITEEIEKQQLLEEATEKALAADRVKSEFLGVMSHELRTPLSGIIGFANLTLEDKRLPPEIRDNIAIIEESGNSLLRILEDILDFSRVEAMGVKLQSVPFSISELAWKVIRLVEEAATAKKLQLFVELGEGLPGTLQGDPERIQQVLLNFLRNAVKFTEKGKITLSVSLLSRDGDSYRLRFAVEDTGLGISEEQQKRIFLPFTQADGSSSRRHDGVGLGLAISKRLVENMGSTIFLKSQVSQGSIFFFEIVLASGTSTKMERTEHAEDLGNLDNGFARRFPARILIVEDNPVNLKIALQLLEKLGYENIRTASNGKEALAVLEGEEIDLIFMDLQMPVIDGLDATRKIRSLEAEHPSVFHPRTIVALTANSSPAIRNQCFEVGMNDYISKPINTIALAKAIALRQ